MDRTKRFDVEGNPLKVIAEHCDRLTRLNAMYADKPFDDDRVEDEIDRICRTVWGCTFGEFDCELIPAAEREWSEEILSDEGERYANACGYTLTYHTGEELEDWGDFLTMIIAEKHGLLCAEAKAAYSLKREAEAFQRTKRAGTLRG